MRDDQRVRLREERVGRGQWLGVGDVEGCGCEALVLQGFREGVRVYQRAAGGVDEDRRRLHLVEGIGVDEVSGFGREGRMEGDDVGLGQLGRDVAIPPNRSHVHAEGGGSMGDGAADAARTDDHEPRASELEAQELRGFPRPPVALMNCSLCLSNASRRVQHQRHREVRRRVGQHVRRDADRDAALARRLEVDVVGADGVVRDDFEAAVHDVLVDAIRQQAQQPVRRLGADAQLLGRRRKLARPDVHVVLRGEAVEGREGEIPRDEATGHG